MRSDIQTSVTARMSNGQVSGRRRFLKKSMGGIFLLTLAKTLPSQLVLADVRGKTLRFFSQHEHQLLRAIADRMVAISPGDTPDGMDVARRADNFLAGADVEIQRQFHLLLAVFNSPFFTFLFDFRLSSFLNMDPPDQDAYIQNWMTSSLEFRRTGFQGLKRLCMSMYYTDSGSWKDIGYDGMFLPQDRE